MDFGKHFKTIYSVRFDQTTLRFEDYPELATLGNWIQHREPLMWACESTLHYDEFQQGFYRITDMDATRVKIFDGAPGLYRAPLAQNDIYKD
ncbi:DUF3884 family protein [Lacticaseibacillus saniviri]